MAARLYLDTARLGLMRPGARRLYQDFVRFAGEEGLGLYWEDFLCSGTENWPESLKSRYPALEAWQGIDHFKESLKRLAGAAPDSHVLLANRSTQLMRLGARLLFRSCRNVLTTDLSWPSYARILGRERDRSVNQLTRVWIHRRLLKRQMHFEPLVELLVTTFVRARCDGLFLPAVDRFGTKLPVGEILRRIRKRAELRFAVIDGAQALAHVPTRLADIQCDLFIAGCHKWLGAHHPLGLGFFGNPATAEEIAKVVHHFARHRLIDDPLLRFTDELEHEESTRYGETVNVTPLLTAQGAVNDCNPDLLKDSLRNRIVNANQVVFRTKWIGWKPLLPTKSLRSGVLLVRPRGERRAIPPAIIRRRLHEQGIAATVYPRGIVRLSMPDAPLPQAELDHLLRSLSDL